MEVQLPLVTAFHPKTALAVKIIGYHKFAASFDIGISYHQMIEFLKNLALVITVYKARC